MYVALLHGEAKLIILFACRFKMWSIVVHTMSAFWLTGSFIFFKAGMLVGFLLFTLTYISTFFSPCIVFCSKLSLKEMKKLTKTDKNKIDNIKKKITILNMYIAQAQL